METFSRTPPSYSDKTPRFSVPSVSLFAPERPTEHVRLNPWTKLRNPSHRSHFEHVKRVRSQVRPTIHSTRQPKFHQASTACPPPLPPAAAPPPKTPPVACCCWSWCMFSNCTAGAAGVAAAAAVSEKGHTKERTWRECRQQRVARLANNCRHKTVVDRKRYAWGSLSCPSR